MSDDEERLQFLLEQTEERIKALDTKASIIIAVMAVLASVNLSDWLEAEDCVVRWGTYGILVLMGFSLFHLILTIRPVNSFRTFFTWAKNETLSNKDYWIATEAQARAFDISKVEDHEKALERLFAVLSKKRVLKNRFFRISMWGIRMVFMLLVILELYIAGTAN